PVEITRAITLQIYDMTGSMIDELVNEEFSRGSYSIRWNALNVSSGVYFAVLKSASNRNIQKLILLK
ncbi:MAG TPA: T9SS type A sorting domain-containing protein, partial [Candidatus Marinimicrobia bacterium]|nr:T9SS type A sorting domain-containing protein [Candidatus Neomarinimicrobiota bacterium]